MDVLGRVLIADDDRTTRVLLRRSLERWGYEVLEAEDGEAAWEALQDGSIRLIVTDWEMPRLDGPGLCQRVRATAWGADACIVLMSSQGGAASERGASVAGADAFVGKPFDPGEVRRFLEDAERG